MIWYFEVLKKYAVFSGRARRKEYWMFALFHIIIYYSLLFLALKVPTLSIVAVVYIFATILPVLGARVRRMHDVGKSGWYSLIPIYSFILACTNGEEGTNEYGPDPKNPESEFDLIGKKPE